MKVVSLYLSTLSTGKYAPYDKSNLANCKWQINWKEIFGEYYNTNCLCRVKAKLITAQSTSLSTANNLGSVRINVTSNYANMTNGLALGIPTLRATTDTQSVITQFIGTLSAGTLIVCPIAPATQPIQFNATVSTTTLTVTSANTILPLGSVIQTNGFSGNAVFIIAQTGNTTYTLSASMGTIGTAQPFLANQTLNPVQLPIGSIISGGGINAGTTILAQLSSYQYTVSGTQNTATQIPMISNPNNYFLDVDTLESFGQNINIPNNNQLTIQFLKSDEQTLMSNIPEYQIWLDFDIDDGQDIMPPTPPKY
jgi:hypothetical protein